MNCSKRSVKDLASAWEDKIKAVHNHNDVEEEFMNENEQDMLNEKGATAQTKKHLKNLEKINVRSTKSCPIITSENFTESCSSKKSVIVEEIYDNEFHLTQIKCMSTERNASDAEGVSHQTSIEDEPERIFLKHTFTVHMKSKSREICHLLLFTDVLLCVKYNAPGEKKQDKIKLIWFLPIWKVSNRHL